MKIFLIFITTIILTTWLVLMGIDTRSLSTNLSQSFEKTDSKQWNFVKNNQLFPQSESEGFLSDTMYTKMYGDDMLVVAWMIGQRPLTSPMIRTDDYGKLSNVYEFQMQEYSGYLFQSFDPLGRYVLQGDSYSVVAEGIGNWIWINEEERVTLINLSSLVTITTDENQYIMLLPNERVILDAQDSQQQLIKTGILKEDVKNLFSADDNMTDLNAWNWFLIACKQYYTQFDLEYNNWKDKTTITDIDPEFHAGGFLFFNDRKKALLDVETIFADIQSLIKNRGNCHVEVCGHEKIASRISDLQKNHGALMNQFQSLLEMYYQRYFIDLMARNAVNEGDAFKHLIYETYGYEASRLQKALGSISTLSEYQTWFSSDTDGQLDEEQVLLNIDIASLDIADLEYIWKFMERVIQSYPNASVYSIQLFGKYMDIGDRLIQTPGTQYDSAHVRQKYVEILGQLRDQIRDGYFVKEGYLYQVKPEMLPDQDQTLVFDIIQDFSNLFLRIQEMKKNADGNFDKNPEFIRIVAHLRWFECIFSNNTEYIREPRICRGLLER